MEKEGNKIPVGIVFMGRSLGELLELKARCRRRLDFLDKYKGRISSYVYEKLRQEYSSYLEAVDGEVALGLADYEIKLSEIRLFSNQLKLLEKTHEERIQELALRHALGEYTKEQYDRLYEEHTRRMKRFAETIAKYSGEESKLAEFLEKVAGDGMISGLKAELEQEARAASREEAVGEAVDRAAEAETEIREKPAEQPAEPLEEPAVPAETRLEEQAPAAEPQPGEPESIVDEQPPSAELLVESIERIDEHQPAGLVEMDSALEETTVDLSEESPAPGPETAEDYSAGTADLPGLQSLEEDKKEKAELAGESLPEEQEPPSGIILDAIFEEPSAESLDDQAQQPAESSISTAEPPGQSALEETVPEPEEVLAEESAAPPPEKEEKPEESATETETGQSPDEADLPNEVETAEDRAVEQQIESGSDSAPIDLDAIMSAAGTETEEKEPPVPVSTGDLLAESETADETPAEPAEEVAEKEEPEPESTEISREALEEEEPARETVEQAPEDQETAEMSEEQSGQVGCEPMDQETAAEEQDEVPDSSTKQQEEIQQEEDEKDLVTERAVSLDEKVELEFDLDGKQDGTDELLTVNQTIDAIKKKTIKCPRCGTMNYAIRWYCENCEATLTSL